MSVKTCCSGSIDRQRGKIDIVVLKPSCENIITIRASLSLKNYPDLISSSIAVANFKFVVSSPRPTQIYRFANIHFPPWLVFSLVTRILSDTSHKILTKTLLTFLYTFL